MKKKVMRIILLVTTIAFILFTTMGCNSSPTPVNEAPSSPDNLSEEQLHNEKSTKNDEKQFTEDNENIDEEIDELDKISKEENSKSEEALNEPLLEKGNIEIEKKKGSLIIKSENPIVVTSKILEQLENEVNELIKSLDELDSIDDENLNF